MHDMMHRSEAEFERSVLLFEQRACVPEHHRLDVLERVPAVGLERVALGAAQRKSSADAG